MSSPTSNSPYPCASPNSTPPPSTTYSPPFLLTPPSLLHYCCPPPLHPFFLLSQPELRIGRSFVLCLREPRRWWPAPVLRPEQPIPLSHFSVAAAWAADRLNFFTPPPSSPLHRTQRLWPPSGLGLSRSAPLDQPGSGSFRVISGRDSSCTWHVIWQLFLKAPSQFAQSVLPDPGPIPGPVPC